MSHKLSADCITQTLQHSYHHWVRLERSRIELQYCSKSWCSEVAMGIRPCYLRVCTAKQRIGLSILSLGSRNPWSWPARTCIANLTITYSHANTHQPYKPIMDLLQFIDEVGWPNYRREFQKLPNKRPVYCLQGFRAGKTPDDPTYDGFQHPASSAIIESRRKIVWGWVNKKLGR